MREINVNEIQEVNGGVSFGEATGMGVFAGGAGALIGGGSLTTASLAGVAGGLIVGAGYAGYSFGTAIGLGSFGSWLGREIYSLVHEYKLLTKCALLARAFKLEVTMLKVHFTIFRLILTLIVTIASLVVLNFFGVSFGIQAQEVFIYTLLVVIAYFGETVQSFRLNPIT